MSRPSAWFHICSGCNKTKRPEHCWADTEESHWCCPHGCLNFGSPANSALWGHEWAAVAWMALAARCIDAAARDEEAWWVGAVWDGDLEGMFS